MYIRTMIPKYSIPHSLRFLCAPWVKSLRGRGLLDSCDYRPVEHLPSVPTLNQPARSVGPGHQLLLWSMLHPLQHLPVVPHVRDAHRGNLGHVVIAGLGCATHGKTPGHALQDRRRVRVGNAQGDEQVALFGEAGKVRPIEYRPRPALYARSSRAVSDPDA